MNLQLRKTIVFGVLILKVPDHEMSGDGFEDDDDDDDGEGSDFDIDEFQIFCESLQSMSLKNPHLKLRSFFFK